MSKKVLSKKEQFTQPQKNRLPLIIAAISVLVVIAVVSTVFFDFSRQDEGIYFGEPVADSRSYMGKLIAMTPVEPIIEDGSIKIPLKFIDENNIVFFEIENDEDLLVPLMAYITPSGRLFVGSSMCEPCRGRTFSLAGETLVCDACKTTYDIENHTFLSGSAACGSYPPVNMNPSVENGMIIIQLEDVLNWRIRS